MRDVDLIIEELAEAAGEQGVNADELSEKVRRAALKVDIRESGYFDDEGS